jgi:hypothetical protein
MLKVFVAEAFNNVYPDKKVLDKITLAFTDWNQHFGTNEAL